MMLCIGALWLAMSTPSMSAIAASTASRGACTAAIVPSSAPSAWAASTMKRPRAAESVISASKSIAPPANRATNSP